MCRKSCPLYRQRYSRISRRLFHRLVRHIDDHLSEIDALAVVFTLLGVCRSVVALDARVEHADNKELNIGVEGIYILNDMVPVLKEVFESVFEREEEP